MSNTVEQLRREIHDAFAWRPYPGDDNLGLRRPDCPWYEGEEVNGFLRGKDWRELTPESILNYPGGPGDLMAFMSCEGFVYYLPAFLKLSLDFDRAVDVASSMLFMLTPPGAGTIYAESRTERFLERVSSLTPGEKRVIVQVIEFLLSEYDRLRFPPGTNDAQDALESYWGLFTDEELESKDLPRARRE